MGTVWAARDPELDREVALKVLRTDYDDPVYHARVVREAQSLARLAHPNVVPVYDVGIDFGLLWVAMQRVRGVTLTEWLGRPHGWREIVGVFVQAAHGLAEAHRAGLVHRDFKPGNAMIDGSGRVMVLDFGLAWAPGVEGARVTAPRAIETADDVTSPLQRQVGSGGSGRDPLAFTLTASDAVVGTPPYMAPEQHSTRDVDARTDQYALAVSMYEGLFGRRPWKGEIPALLSAKLQGPPPRPDTLPQLPERLWRVIARAMAPDPERRWPDLPTMIAALERATDTPRRAPWIVAAAAFVVGGVAAAMPADLPDPCASVEASLQQVWNPERRGELLAAFESSPRGGAHEAGAQASARIDAAVARWQAQARAACTASLEQDGADPTPTLACVDRAALAIDAALDVLATPDDRRIARSVRLVESVTSRNDCAAPTDDAPAMDAELRRMFERGRALMAAGALPEVRELGQQLLREANERGDAAAVARALLLVGGASMDMGEWEEAQPRLADAVWTATASGDDEAATTAATKLVELCVYRHDTECAKPWIRNAEAGLARLGERGVLQRTELDLALGDVALREGNADAALAHYQRALDGRIAAGGEEQLFVAVMLHAIGTAQAEAGRHEQALASFERSAELERRIFGERDSGRAITLELAAGSLNALGRNAEARAAYEQAIALVDLAYGEESRHAIRMRGNLVMILTDAGELDAALALGERVVALKKAAFGETDVQVAMGLHNLARVRMLRGDAAGACRDFEGALELWERALGGEHVDLAHPLGGLAHCRRRLGDPGTAVEAGRRAQALLRSAGRPEDGSLAFEVAQGLWALGRLGEAIAVAERAVEIVPVDAPVMPLHATRGDISRWLEQHR